MVRDFGADVPPIEAYAGELNQVWTNLIDNAIDAMDGEGTLRVATGNDGDGVMVEIADTGPGCRREVAAHAFEAFYTTKDVGRAPDSASTSPGGSWSSGTAARSPSTRNRAGPCCGSNSPSVRETRLEPARSPALPTFLVADRRKFPGYSARLPRIRGNPTGPPGHSVRARDAIARIS